MTTVQGGRDVLAPVRSDAYRAMLIALGPGLIAGTVALLLFGYGVDGPAVPGAVGTYALLLLCSLPALPVMGMTLVRWLPRGGRPESGLAFSLFLFSPLWHILVLEAVGRITGQHSILLRPLERTLLAYVALTVTTALGWGLYRRRETRA